MASVSIPTLHTIRSGGKPAMARALALIETADGKPALASLLDAAACDPVGEVLGLTGPPGVGKSTLTHALIERTRQSGKTVGVIAVDPSSQVTGGALLGDRTWLRTDPGDTGVFIRSMAARDRLGGLSDHAIGAAVLMRAVYDLTIIETVGVGQSEADIATIADIVLLLIQPGSGDSLQFMKAGIMELPDLVAVTKADMGHAARRAMADVSGALSLQGLATSGLSRNGTNVLMVSAATGTGIDALVAAVVTCLQQTKANGSFTERRERQFRLWLKDRITRRFGSEGAGTIDFDAALRGHSGPFSASDAITRLLRDRLLLT